MCLAWDETFTLVKNVNMQRGRLPEPDHVLDEWTNDTQRIIDALGHNSSLTDEQFAEAMDAEDEEQRATQQEKYARDLESAELLITQKEQAVKIAEDKFNEYVAERDSKASTITSSTSGLLSSVLREPSSSLSSFGPDMSSVQHEPVEIEKREDDAPDETVDDTPERFIRSSMRVPENWEFPKMEKNAKPNLKTWFPPGQDRPDGPFWWNAGKELLNKYVTAKEELQAPLRIESFHNLLKKNMRKELQPLVECIVVDFVEDILDMILENDAEIIVDRLTTKQPIQCFVRLARQHLRETRPPLRLSSVQREPQTEKEGRVTQLQRRTRVPLLLDLAQGNDAEVKEKITAAAVESVKEENRQRNMVDKESVDQDRPLWKICYKCKIEVSNMFRYCPKCMTFNIGNVVQCYDDWEHQYMNELKEVAASREQEVVFTDRGGRGGRKITGDNRWCKQIHKRVERWVADELALGHNHAARAIQEGKDGVDFEYCYKHWPLFKREYDRDHSPTKMAEKFAAWDKKGKELQGVDLQQLHQETHGVQGRSAQLRTKHQFTPKIFRGDRPNQGPRRDDQALQETESMIGVLHARRRYERQAQERPGLVLSSVQREPSPSPSPRAARSSSWRPTRLELCPAPSSESQAPMTPPSVQDDDRRYSAISWTSQRQTTMSRSTAEAEIIEPQGQQQWRGQDDNRWWRDDQRQNYRRDSGQTGGIQVIGNNTKDGMMTETATAADADDPEGPVKLRPA